ncbi:hypothetical protein PISMIDRAFT_687008 [Pisolithus microcarpus 441]|uniref:Uncharacterized protein n=1 Tax=Pisolithus microcarpus 441 TaxID=765257 RepID=A0A0C9Z767_9AGAM|nr:hypothetical protein BKA83DRAFT_687008 [Pisolithus microcarpus]KIK15733.1 hypothetical protein PISMIDRAFT_687008 [Pisolithus microcarpus 441]
MTNSSESREDFSTEPGIRSSLLTLAATISGDPSRKKRKGEVVATIHDDQVSSFPFLRLRGLLLRALRLSPNYYSDHDEKKLTVSIWISRRGRVPPCRSQ